MGLALGGAMALSGVVPAAPAEAAPSADSPVATTQLNRVTPLEVRYQWAGASGFQFQLGVVNPQWADFPGVTPPQHAGPEDLTTGTDVIVTGTSGAVIGQKHRSTGATATVTVPQGQTYKAASGWSVLTQDADGAPHVLRATADGTTRDLPVTGLPAGARPTGTYETGGSVRRLALAYTVDGTTSVGLVDLADGTFRTYVTGVAGTTPQILFNDRWLVVNKKAVRVDSAPGTEPAPVDIPVPFKALGVVGDHILSGDPSFISSDADLALTAVSLVTGARHTVLDKADGQYRVTPDGGLLADAGPSSDRHVHRVLPTADGDVAAEPVFTVPPVRATVDGLMIAGGELLMYGNATANSGGDAVYAVPLDTDGKPTGIQNPRSSFVTSSPCLGGDAACPQLEALGDGRFAYLSTGTDGKESVHVAGLGTTTSTEPTGDSAGRIGAGTGRYVLYNGGPAGVQKVADFPSGADGQTALNRTRSAAAVWGQRLWTPGTTQGSVVGYDLKSKTNAATVATGAPCTPSELQAVNTWLYWTCGTAGPAGVHDRATGRNITVPAGPSRLADGYLVRENRTSHELLLTDFHTGTATTRTVAVLPTADQNTGGHTGRWAVDRFGGNVAYLTENGRVAIVTANVPTSPLARMEAQTDPQPGPTIADPWRPVWQLSKPSAWTLTLSNSSGTTVRTLTGASTAAAVRPSWNATTDTGTRVPRGTYTWQLTAEPRDGQGAALTQTGTTTVD
ncbi:FlgD immunoglobulin-like domain containing protein [Streptomyces aurantiacus]|uniref:FlgD/Vpr Ig-like domain-containing protein n=1 Tax=Streptomyces aurantiacus TaxID=47760 RepID=A0A7G1NWG0_9ACTN|nr:FlgD immunoglobulin-like domain containing protein [Streptomyces aurantiacus]BCL27458.1 hypothetical protein GCM10017557_23170 [Streptomyces aurantiacus]